MNTDNINRYHKGDINAYVIDKSASFLINLDDLIKFCEENNRLPISRNGFLEGRLRGFISRNKSDIIVSKIRSKYIKKRVFTFDENLVILTKFCEKNNRLPERKSDNIEERSLCTFLYSSNCNELQEIRDKYRTYKPLYKGLDELKKFCEENNRVPKRNSNDEEKKLFNFMNRNNSLKEVIELRNKYSNRKTFSYRLNELIEFCESHKRLPNSSNRGIEGTLSQFMVSNKDRPKIKEIHDKYLTVRRSFSEGISDLSNFCKKNNRLPRRSNNREESRLANIMYNNKNNKDIISIVSKYKVK
jgi:hypothetical protein